MATTTQLGSYGTHTGSASPGDDVRALLGDFAADFDVPALTTAYIATINTQLDGTGITLHGSDFYGTDPARADATDLIRTAIQAVDLGSLVEAHAR